MRGSVLTPSQRTSSFLPLAKKATYSRDSANLYADLKSVWVNTELEEVRQVREVYNARCLLV